MIRFQQVSFAFALALTAAVVLPNEADAQGWCVTCDAQGCDIIFGDGWYSCKNIPDGCLLQGEGCIGGFALLPDGRLSPPDSEESPLGAWVEVAVLESTDQVTGGRWYRRGCGDVVVERRYSAAVAERLRTETRLLTL